MIGQSSVEFVGCCGRYWWDSGVSSSSSQGSSLEVIPPCKLKGLVIFTLLAMGVGLAAYLWFVCCGPPCGIPEPEVEAEIRTKLVKEWESPSTAEHLEVGHSSLTSYN